MKSFLNFIRKNGLYAFINLFGLTVSLAFVLLLAVFVSRQLTTDSFQENADRIYIYANEDFIGSAYYLQKHLLDHFPEVEKATSYLSGSGITGLGELHMMQRYRHRPPTQTARSSTYSPSVCSAAPWRRGRHRTAVP